MSYPQWFGKGGAGKWKRALEGVVSAILLLPVPVFAAISGFTWGTGTWNNYGGSDVDPFSNVDAGLTTPSQGALRFYMNSNSGTMNGGDTWTIVGNFNVTDSATSLGGSWTNLSNFSNIMGGSAKLGVSVKVTDPANPSNPTSMFSGTYSSGTPPASASLTNTGSLAVNTGYTVTVTFTFLEVKFTPLASTPIMLQLQ